MTEKKSLFQRLTSKFSGVKKRFRRAYVPTNTPEEVTRANELNTTVPSEYAHYIFVAGKYDRTDNVGVGSFLILSHETVAEQGAHLYPSYSSEYEVILATIIEALAAVSLEDRQTENFAVVTTDLNIIKAFNDFTMLAQFGTLPENPTSTDQLQHELIKLSMTFRSLRMSYTMNHEKRFLDFLNEKTERILHVYMEQ